MSRSALRCGRRPGESRDRTRDRARPGRPAALRLRTRLLVVVVFLSGAVILLYPTIADWTHRGRSTAAIAEYGRAVDDLSAEAREATLAAARAYNAALAGSTGDEYWQQLRAEGSALMARIRIPAIDVDLPVFHGTSEATLLEGVGHLEGTALPVGGDGTHAVVTAHRGLVNAKLFTDLDRVGIGDLVAIDVLGEELHYRVTDTRIVEPDATEVLAPVAGRDLVTLITCTPLGVNTQRILVTAERVALPQHAAASQQAGGPGFPWWGVAVLAAVVLSAGYLRPASGRRLRVAGAST